MRMKVLNVGLWICCVAMGIVIVVALANPNFRMGKGSTIILAGPGETVEIGIEIARTPRERERGLMERAALPEDHGMLFVFSEGASIQQFWMKNTLIPLDILFFTADGSLVSTTTMTPCKADPCPLYPSRAPAAYALEVPAGFVARHGIDRGWRLTIPEGGF
ncbi:MAG: hypothetical protein G01um101425_357 [Candidatus Peregrinibacteria bacterium Gr01-1014_25]|nr:MAG: hypothetical protein G01um101425_357 [Candidatus Peregrinibacteria bacterium Gr01-1014_25]